MWRVVGQDLGNSVADRRFALRRALRLLLLSLGVFLSPVLFPLTLFPERWRWLLWLNPMTAPVLGYQSALLQGAWPPAGVWLALLAWVAPMCLCVPA